MRLGGNSVMEDWLLEIKQVIFRCAGHAFFNLSYSHFNIKSLNKIQTRKIVVLGHTKGYVDELTE